MEDTTSEPQTPKSFEPQTLSKTVVIVLHAVTIVLGSICIILTITAIFLARWGINGDDYVGLFAARKNGNCDSVDLLFPEINFLDPVTALMFCGLLLMIASLVVVVVFTIKATLEFLLIAIAVLAFVAGVFILSAAAHFYYENRPTVFDLGASWAIAMTAGILSMVYCYPLFLLVHLKTRKPEQRKEKSQISSGYGESTVIGTSFPVAETSLDSSSLETDAARPNTRDAGQKNVVFVLGEDASTSTDEEGAGKKSSGENSFEREPEKKDMSDSSKPSEAKTKPSEATANPATGKVAAAKKDPTPAPLPPAPKPNVDTPATEMLANGRAAIKVKPAPKGKSSTKAKGGAKGGATKSPGAKEDDEENENEEENQTEGGDSAAKEGEGGESKKGGAKGGKKTAKGGKGGGKAKAGGKGKK